MSILGNSDKVTLPFERSDVGDGYASSGEIIYRTANPEECERYGIKEVSDLRRRVFRDLDLRWNPQQENKAVRLWKLGKGVPEMAQIFKRDEWETLLLVLHLLREGKIDDDRGLQWVKEGESNG